MNIKLEELNNLKRINDENNQGGFIFIKDNQTLYKIIYNDYFFPEEIIRNINFQIKNNIPNTPKIYEKIYIDKTFRGYSMEYLQNTITFKNSIKQEITTKNKINAILDVYKSLKYIHENNLSVGDIHLDNLLISTTGKGHIIDLDYLLFPGDEFKFSELYLIKLNNKDNKINISSPYTDNIKLMLSSLSILLNINIEKYIDEYTHDINLETIYQDIIIRLNNKHLKKYFIQLMKSENVYYFDDYILKYYSKEIKRLLYFQ